ncbi:MAG: YgiT-type zinc finger protein [Chromatiales bacterium]|nr:YgiT-type zinc finger protein [Chromatiales bacterium]
MHCPSCGNHQFEAGKTQVAAHHNGVAVVVDSVPSLICALCGEVCFRDGVSQAVRLLIENASQASAGAARVSFAQA